jgi:hypothetical protein
LVEAAPELAGLFVVAAAGAEATVSGATNNGASARRLVR